MATINVHHIASCGAVNGWPRRGPRCIRLASAGTRCHRLTICGSLRIVLHRRVHGREKSTHLGEESLNPSKMMQNRRMQELRLLTVGTSRRVPGGCTRVCRDLLQRAKTATELFAR